MFFESLHCLEKIGLKGKNTLPETNMAPENGMVGRSDFLLGPGIFSGAFAVSFREIYVCSWDKRFQNYSIVASTTYTSLEYKGFLKGGPY